MYEIARRSRVGFALLEDGKLVTDARISQLADAQAHFNHFRKSECLHELAMRLRRQSDDARCSDVQTALCDQVLIDSCVEKGVLEPVVDVTIDVVVHPTGRQH